MLYGVVQGQLPVKVSNFQIHGVISLLVKMLSFDEKAVIFP